MFPVTFVVGAAVGAATTYVYKDEPAQQKLIVTGKKLKEGVSSFIESFRDKPEEAQAAPEELTEVVAEEIPAETIVEEAEDKVEAAAKA